MKTLTKTNIEELAKEIISFLEANELASDVSIYFNNKVMRARGTWDENYNYIPKWETTDNVNPHDYFEYAAYDHIISMSFEGPLYHVLNYGFGDETEEAFRAIFEKYGLYYELGNAWNMSVYLINDNIEVEYTKYEKPKETIYIYRGSDNPPELQTIMNTWYELSKEVGDKGSCVIGAGFEFEWQDNKYFMSACSPWQGSISWETHKDVIQNLLESVGATNIYYNWGRLD